MEDATALRHKSAAVTLNEGLKLKEEHNPGHLRANPKKEMSVAAVCLWFTSLVTSS